MPRYFKKLTEDEFRGKIREQIIPLLIAENEWTPEELAGMNEESILGNALSFEALPVVKADYQKVDFDLENTYVEKGDLDFSENPDEVEFVGINTLPNGLTYLGVYAGGDWEHPIHFVVYWSGTSFRAYVPSNGNTYNKDTRAAYGNDEVKDGPDSAWPKIDLSAILADIQKRIQEKV